ncbi:MAG: protein tyrosine phosphatase family protein [Pseudomonadota bacterium]
MEPTHILNWRRLTPRVTTSGQPSEAELAELAAMGVTRIINLGPHHNTGALEDEAGTVDALGMVYDYIPVEFEAPKEGDYDRFKAVMEENVGEMIHVHCIYNARVSAFFFRYAREWDDLSVAAASHNMESIWRPGDDWADFTGLKIAKGQPNRYKGKDY